MKIIYYPLNSSIKLKFLINFLNLKKKKLKSNNKLKWKWNNEQ